MTTVDTPDFSAAAEPAVSDDALAQLLASEDLYPTGGYDSEVSGD